MEDIIKNLMIQYEKEFKKCNSTAGINIRNELLKYKIDTVFAIDLIYFVDSDDNVIHSFDL